MLALSSYAWNHHLSLSFARYAKAVDPGTLTLLGGPNFPLTAQEQEDWVRGMPEIDVHVRGPTYEGERAFLNLLERLVQVGGQVEGLWEEPVPGNIWIDRATGELVDGGEVERIRDLDEIPSPYLAGLMDDFFETGYFPLMQISRGCPFTCAFCNSSTRSNSKVFRHSVENVQADLLYIAERVKPETPLCFADDNFGMYPWDEEVADYVAHLQDRFDWPHYIRTTTGKNRSDRIIRVMRKARGVLPMTSAVQSLNPTVLKNIKRDNISLETYSEIQKEVQAQGLQAYGELILGLPGETRDSFMTSIRDLLRTGVTRVSAHQLMLLHGAPLSNPESRQRFGFETRFRVVARNIGNYLGEPVIETEEVVVATDTLSFEDYLEVRVFHLLLTIFFYEGNFDEAFQFAKRKGIEPFELIKTVQSRLPEAPKPFREMVEAFLRESREELFETREDCVRWSIEHYGELIEGTVGGNLLSKYSMIGRFLVTGEATAFLEDGLRSVLGSELSDLGREALSSVMSYLRCVLLSSPFAVSLEESPSWTTRFDVEAWSAAGYADDLEAHVLEEPITYIARVTEEHRVAIERRIRTFGDHPAGLGKFTRTMFARDLRRSVTPAHAELARRLA
ncbi:MAG: B12-binding domain-containing radical SAM protein [Gemmatimonadota bacterium]